MCSLNERINQRKNKFMCGEIYFLKSSKYDILYKCFLCDHEMNRLCDFIRHMIVHLIINKVDAEALIAQVLGTNDDEDEENAQQIQCEELNDEELLGTDLNLMEIEIYDGDDETLGAFAEDLLKSGQEIEAEEPDLVEYCEEDESVVIEKLTSVERKETETPNIDIREHPPEGITLQEHVSVDNAETNTPIAIRNVRRFKTRTLAKKNMSKERIHKCDLCDSSFTESSYLRIHRFRHLGIKPHSCNICDKKYTSRTELTLHMRIHTDERPYVCEDCGLRFRGTGRLYSHRQQHTRERKYACETCGKSFFNKQSLTEHEISHTNERPFACDVCGATFQRQKSMMQHKKLHSGVKNYVCKICGKAFAQYAGLYSHMKHHNIAKET